ncbi:AmmeMemoRadiSam system protein B [Methylocaldum szegediense]|uniref:AmmeMemoRadiSam system protein B n=1 Tax=Methylocaldum szegediense TaxID=73780 RepID=UPI00040FA7B8|nr:AmmeMemoRadiSam system protein B [Methylocaldum szegediense]
MKKIRQPAVAGLFYPSDADQLRAMVQGFLQDADTSEPLPKAIIAPHAGYVYSGPVAASAYALLRPGRDTFRRVILIGPSHRVGFHGIAVSRADIYATPLGNVPIDYGAIEKILDLPFIKSFDEAHLLEHSLEVHLPFLQTVLDRFELVPLVVGSVAASEVGTVLERLWSDAETLTVISSDLSHYHDYATAKRMDQATSLAIERLRPEDIGHDSACGSMAINGLLHFARQTGLKARTLDLRNSGDTAGSKDRVVGYGSYAFH